MFSNNNALLIFSYKGKQGWAPASYLEKPAEAVLRQTNKVEVISSVRDLRGHRRSLPAETMRAIAPPSTVTCAAVSSARSSPRHLQLGKTNSDAHNSRIKTGRYSLYMFFLTYVIH